MNCSKPQPRRGFTLLELATSTAVLAVLATACMVLVRTSYTSWNRHEDDHAQRQAGLAVLRHITRQARQCRGVVAISLATDNSGTLSLLTPDNRVLVWDHDSGTSTVNFGIDTADQVLATGVKELTFVGLKLDGSTQSTEPGLIHSIQCTTRVDITRPSGIVTDTHSTRAWLRAW